MDKLEQLEKCLKKIGWSIRGNSRQKFIFNHKNEETNWAVKSDRIELHNDNIFGKKASECGMSGAICFYFKDCSIEIIRDNCISVGIGEGAYVLFYNHNH